MKNYYRVMLGSASRHAAECFAGNFIGTDFDIDEDLTGKLPDEWRKFNRQFIPVWLKIHPQKSKVTAGLACGALWTVSKGIKTGDVVLCPDGSGRYRVGEVSGDYYYAPGQILHHRRPVRWLDHYIDRPDMSEGLRNSAGSINTVSNLTRAGYNEELERLIGASFVPKPVVVADPTVEDASAFALEEHLEEFLIKNWAQTDLGREYDIYAEDGESVGQQYQTDTGPLDILAISKDKKRLLVVELKKGRASDVVVGQTLRYMGYSIRGNADRLIGVLDPSSVRPEWRPFGEVFTADAEVIVPVSDQFREYRPGRVMRKGGNTFFDAWEEETLEKKS